MTDFNNALLIFSNSGKYRNVFLQTKNVKELQTPKLQIVTGSL